MALDLLPKADDCVICQSCSKYESELVAKLRAKETSSFATRAQRGSLVYLDFEGLFANRHDTDASSATSATMSEELAFAILAPRVSLTTTNQKRLITTSAGRLHLVLNTVKEKFESELLSTSQIEYFTSKQFENLLIQCGFHWIPRDQVQVLFESFDSNKSGNLHVSEVLFIAEKAHALCREILSGHVTDYQTLSRDLISSNPNSPPEFLTNQLLPSS